MLKPFPYQVSAIHELRSARGAGKRRLLLCMLMGAGKTLCALELMRLCSEKGRKCLFICDRRMLADQGVERAAEHGLEAGIMMSGRPSTWAAPCQFASKQTVESWLKSGRITLPDFDLIIVDEAHRAVSEKWVALFNRWPKATLIGLTATPCLGNGDGMGAYYDYLCQPIKPSELLAMGRNVPIRAFAPHIPNLKGLKRDGDGDYSAKSLSERMTRANLIGDVVGWWKRLAENRPSIYFCCDVAHSMAVRDQFKDAGITSEVICDETPDEERAEIKAKSEAAEIKVVVNCDVLCEGIDWPFISCIGLVRPTKRLRRYLQMAGRGMRSCAEKRDMLLIDHSGCVIYHGFPDVDREWSLSACDNIDKKNQAMSKEKMPICCIKCKALFSGTLICPACGHVHAVVRTAKDHGKGNGTLVEINGSELDAGTKQVLHQRFWGTCVGAAIKRRAKAGMAAAMFSQKFGIPPWQAGVSPLPEERGQWHLPAEVVFPGFVRRPKESSYA